MSSDIIKVSAAGKIAIAFDLDFPSDVQWEDVREELAKAIVHLLNTDVERLMRVLYRIDVKESSVNDIFDTAFPPDVPLLLADLIMERQLQKAESRRAFAENKEKQDEE